MRASINPPSRPFCEPAYQQECQFSLEPSLAGLVAMAEKAGWDRQQVLLAVMMLASGMIEAEKPVFTARGGAAALQ